MIYEYMVIEGESHLNHFNNRICDLMEAGWLLHGNVIITPCDSELYYHQTLVREKKDERKDDKEEDQEDDCEAES